MLLIIELIIVVTFSDAKLLQKNQCSKKNNENVYYLMLFRQE